MHKLTGGGACRSPLACCGLRFPARHDFSRLCPFLVFAHYSLQSVGNLMAGGAPPSGDELRVHRQCGAEGRFTASSRACQISPSLCCNGFAALICVRLKTTAQISHEPFQLLNIPRGICSEASESSPPCGGVAVDGWCRSVQALMKKGLLPAELTAALGVALRRPGVCKNSG